MGFFHIYERFLLCLILWAAFDRKIFYLICFWWFDDLYGRVLSGDAVKKSPLEHCGKDFLVYFYFSESCIPIPGPVKWILSDQQGFCLLHLIFDKTGGFTLTSDWPESCFSNLQCRGCLALTFNDFDIYTLHSDKSVPVQMEGLYTYRT